MRDLHHRIQGPRISNTALLSPWIECHFSEGLCPSIAAFPHLWVLSVFACAPAWFPRFPLDTTAGKSCRQADKELTPGRRLSGGGRVPRPPAAERYMAAVFPARRRMQTGRAADNAQRPSSAHNSRFPTPALTRGQETRCPTPARQPLPSDWTAALDRAALVPTQGV